MASKPFPDPMAAWQALSAQWTDLLHAQPEAHWQDLQALQASWAEQHTALWRDLGKTAPATSVAETDRRFGDPAWSESPVFRYLREAYRINAETLTRAADSAPVANPQKRAQMRFVTRQLVDALAPSNYAATNPEFIKLALETQGESIKRGIENLIADIGRGHISMTDESQFEVGRNLAVTPGTVVFENELIQLIQYAPSTEQVARRPFLIVPPCINKYYILDLQPENSFVRHLVAEGHTVFLISWRNVQQDQAGLGWDDYLELGPIAALDVARQISSAQQVNALGFCVGGTILSAALAVAKARGDDPVASLTLLTTLLDFSDTGEIGCLVDEDSVRYRETSIGKGGLLRGAELAAVFSALRANDLIWQYVVGNYLKGGTPPAFDLLYWNSDSTNLPGPFLAWYLRNLYLENRLRIPGDLAMCGVRANLSALDMPVYLYASREDHIVPWASAYRSRELLGGETTFVLGASGHIAGVINPPAKRKRSFWSGDAQGDDADDWLANSTETPGSWWPHWYAWLRRFGDGVKAAPKRAGSVKFKPGEAAPGRYVKQRA